MDCDAGTYHSRFTKTKLKQLAAKKTPNRSNAQSGGQITGSHPKHLAKGSTVTADESRVIGEDKHQANK